MNYVLCIKVSIYAYVCVCLWMRVTEYVPNIE